ncbi:hypothetical protein H8S37_03880 [Mediterraneibacter sp. NSJ-55]|uniref:Uncharacterized protein n=1 Tax=Mediterraneibacter hominis TaxID=2763054 RepID=A0A923LHF2_9FIRM|nr:hypothetical protein [Mediterraneibacter hominis]
MKILKLNKACTHEKLIDYGFKKYGTSYKLIFPLYKYKDIPTISISFLVSFPDNYIGYDVIDNNSELLYFPYYDSEYSNKNKNIVLKKVISGVNKILCDMNRNKIIQYDRKDNV